MLIHIEINKNLQMIQLYLSFKNFHLYFIYYKYTIKNRYKLRSTTFLQITSYIYIYLYIYLILKKKKKLMKLFLHIILTFCSQNYHDYEIKI